MDIGGTVCIRMGGGTGLHFVASQQDITKMHRPLAWYLVKSSWYHMISYAFNRIRTLSHYILITQMRSGQAAGRGSRLSGPGLPPW